MIKRIFLESIKIHDETQNVSNQGSGLFFYIYIYMYIYIYIHQSVRISSFIRIWFKYINSHHFIISNCVNVTHIHRESVAWMRCERCSPAIRSDEVIRMDWLKKRFTNYIYYEYTNYICVCIIHIYKYVSFYCFMYIYIYICISCV